MPLSIGTRPLPRPSTEPILVSIRRRSDYLLVGQLIPQLLQAVGVKDLSVHYDGDWPIGV